jgi:hypothetical protein
MYLKEIIQYWKSMLVRNLFVITFLLFTASPARACSEEEFQNAIAQYLEQLETSPDEAPESKLKETSHIIDLANQQKIDPFDTVEEMQEIIEEHNDSLYFVFNSVTDLINSTLENLLNSQVVPNSNKYNASSYEDIFPELEPILTRKSLEEYENINLTHKGISESHQKSEIIFSFEHQGQQKIFRVLNQNSNTNMAASILNEKLNMSLAPKYEFGKVNGKLGIIGDFVHGEHVKGATKLEIIRKYGPKYDENKLKQKFSDADAFSFLTGNKDVHAGNFKIEKNGNISIFDFDTYSSFSSSLPEFTTQWVDLNPSSTGTYYTGSFVGDLPEGYTAEFINNLNNLTVEEIKSSLNEVLDPDQINALIIRRAVILKDAQTKPTY